MEGLTWKSLTAPEYVMTFLEGFLLLALPSLGLGNAVDGGGVIDVKAWPSPVMLIAATGLGLMNGIRSLRNLRAPAPLPRPPGGQP